MTAMRLHLACVTALAAALVLTSHTSEAAAPTVAVAKVQYDSPGDDTGSNTSLNKEWVQLTNPTSKTKTLTGWTLRDPQGHLYTFPAFKLKAGKSVTVHTGTGTDTAAHLYWGETGYVWNNTGDTAILKDATKKSVDSCKWTDGPGSIVC